METEVSDFEPPIDDPTPDDPRTPWAKAKVAWLVAIPVVLVAIVATLFALQEDPDTAPPATTTTTVEETTTTTEAPTTTSTTVPPTTGTTQPPVAGQPGPSNTGPLDSCNETISSSVAASRLVAGNVSDVCINGQITLTSAMNGHKLSNFTLNASRANYGVRADGSGLLNITFEDGKIYNMVSTGIYGSGWTARRLEVTESGADAFKPRNNTRIEASWGHHNGTTVGSHADFVQFDGPDGLTTSNVTIIGNFCDMPASQRNEVSPITGTNYNTNACIQINDLITLVNVRSESNWMVGGNFTLNCDPPGENQIVFVDNTYLSGSAFGVGTGGRCAAEG